MVGRFRQDELAEPRESEQQYARLQRWLHLVSLKPSEHNSGERQDRVEFYLKNKQRPKEFKCLRWHS